MNIVNQFRNFCKPKPEPLIKETRLSSFNGGWSGVPSIIDLGGTRVGSLIPEVNDDIVSVVLTKASRYLSSPAWSKLFADDAEEKSLTQLARELAEADEPSPRHCDLPEAAQIALEEVLAAGMAEMGAKGAVGILMEADTGQIRAMASLPDFDPNLRPPLPRTRGPPARAAARPPARTRRRSPPRAPPPPPVRSPPARPPSPPPSPPPRPPPSSPA